jgi:hypothetical protein
MTIGAMLRRAAPPRVLFALVLGLLALVVQNSPLRERTFLNSWNLALFDEVASVQRNTVGGNAPPVMIVDFAGEARRDYFASHPQTLGPSFNGRDYPQSTPLAVIQSTMADARRMGARAVVVDIDISVMLSERDPREVADFTAFLKAWAADPGAPLAVFVRTALPVGEGDTGPPALFQTPWDATVATAPNLDWGGSGGQASADGVLRYQYYFTCPNDPAGRRTAMPSAAVLVSTASWDGRRGLAKRAVHDGLARGGVCAEPDRSGGRFTVLAGGRRLAPEGQRALIDYHLADPATAGASPALPPGYWAQGARAISVWQPGEVLDNLGPEVGQGSIMILGSSQPLFPDVHWTPYREQAGDIILANCIRGMALAGPIRSGGILWQLVGLVIILLGLHFFFRFSIRLHERARRIHIRPLAMVAGAATSAPAAKTYALGLIYLISIIVGSFLLSHGYWQMTPFIGASIYILIGDTIEILEGGSLADEEENIVYPEPQTVET